LAVEHYPGILPSGGRVNDSYYLKSLGTPDESVGGFGVGVGEETIGQNERFLHNNCCVIAILKKIMLYYFLF
jgi:hypothetical protein